MRGGYPAQLRRSEDGVNIFALGARYRAPAL